MNAETKRFVKMLRDSNDPNATAQAMLTALLQHVDDLRNDDPADDDIDVNDTLDTLEDALDTASHALGTL